MPDAANSAEAPKRVGWICHRERETVRLQIVSAAVEILNRNGPEAVTLGAVARETKIPRATVYSLFANRRDLMAALPPAEQEPLAVQEEVITPAAPDESETPLAPEAAQVPSEIPAEAEAEIAQAPAEAEESGNASSYDALMRQQAEALEALTKQVIVPNPRQARDAAMSRLDARLAVAEQSVSALEQRVGERLKSLETDTQGLSETLKTLRARLEKFEERQVSALADLRLDVHKLGKGEKGSAVAEAFVEPHGPEPSENHTEPAERIEPHVKTILFEKPAEAETEGDDIPKMPTYLTSARLAAIQASATVAAPPSRPHRTPVQHFLHKNRWLLIAAAAVLVTWFDVYVFAHYQPALGETQSVAVVPEKLASAIKPAWSPRAQLVRGLKYLNGTGVPVNVDAARHWLERAARAGNPVAQNLMGVLCQTGTGVPANIHTAIAWYEAAAAQGNLKAMTNLGKLYAGGWREGTDYVKAAEWFAKAAQYGEGDAQFDLAVLYEMGQGVSRNPVEAYKWYMIAGKAGDNKAATRASTLAAEIDPDALSAADSAIAGFTPLPAIQAANDVPRLAG